MSRWRECPWYAWVFSFFSGFALTAATMLWFMGAFFRRKFSLELWFRFIEEFLLDWFVLFMLPFLLLSFALYALSPEVWTWLGLPIVYLLGFYPAVRLWHWRKEHL